MGVSRNIGVMRVLHGFKGLFGCFAGGSQSSKNLVGERGLLRLCHLVGGSSSVVYLPYQQAGMMEFGL